VLSGSNLLSLALSDSSVAVSGDPGDSVPRLLRERCCTTDRIQDRNGIETEREAMTKRIRRAELLAALALVLAPHGPNESRFS
jgi:hypothetical protein